MKRRELRKYICSQIEHLEDKATNQGFFGEACMTLTAYRLALDVLNILRNEYNHAAWMTVDNETIIQNLTEAVGLKKKGQHLVELFYIPGLTEIYEHEKCQLAAFLRVTIERLEAEKSDIPFGFDERTEGDLKSFHIALGALTASPSAWLHQDQELRAFVAIHYDAAQELNKYEIKLIPLYQIADLYAVIRR